MLFLAGVLHISWFRGGLAGYLKRQRTATANKSDRLVSDKPSEKPSETLADAVTRIDPTVTSTPLLSTPEDSPLVTPRTPSITPFSLRDAYLPTLAIPNLQLPKVAVPTLPNFADLTIGLPTRDLNLGFKVAVKHHWEDRKAALGGMGLNLGGLGLRRRVRQEEHAQKHTEVRVEEVSVE